MEKAKNYLDPKRDKSGRNDAVGLALSLAHDEIKKAIEIAYLEGALQFAHDKQGENKSRLTIDLNKLLEDEGR